MKGRHPGSGTGTGIIENVVQKEKVTGTATDPDGTTESHIVHTGTGHLFMIGLTEMLTQTGDGRGIITRESVIETGVLTITITPTIATTGTVTAAMATATETTPTEMTLTTAGNGMKVETFGA